MPELLVMTRSRRVADIVVILVGLSIIWVSLLFFISLPNVLSFRSKLSFKSPRIKRDLFLTLRSLKTSSI